MNQQPRNSIAFSTYSAPAPSLNMPCAEFVTTGFCQYGDKCLFNHEVTTSNWASSPFYSPTPPLHKERSFENTRIHNHRPSPPSSSKTSPSVHSISLQDNESGSLSPPPPVNTTRRQPRQRGRRKPRQSSNGGGPAGYYAHPAVVYTQPFPFYGMPTGSDEKPKPLYSVPSIPPSVDVQKLVLKADDLPSSKANEQVPQPSFPLAAFARPESYLQPFHIFQRPPPVVYDFDDADSEPKHVVVEDTVEVSHYEGHNVGVLGGGVKLGMIKRPKPVKALKAADVVTMDALSFDDDSEDEAADSTIIGTTTVAFTVSQPDSEDEEAEGEVTPTGITIDTTIPVSPSAVPCLASASTMRSWADDEDDSAFFDEPLPSFGDHLEAVVEVAEPEVIEPEVIEPIKTVVQAPPKPKAFSYASAVSGAPTPSPATKLVALPTIAIATSQARPALPLSKPSFASILSTDASSRSSSVTRKSGSEDTPRSSGSPGPKKDTRRRGRSTGRTADSVKQAPEIYGKLGFALSPAAAREVEQLRLRAQRQIKAAAASDRRGIQA